MGHLYRVGSIFGTEYVNTVREADHCRPGGEEPESVIRVDGAGECNRLERYLEASERSHRRTRRLLEELRDACPTELIFQTRIGREVQQYIQDNPLPPADSADRDGQRSYGG